MSKSVARSGAADQAYRALITQILDGTLAPGSRLPVEQALAETLGIGRSSLRGALDRLRQDKLIVSRQGDGNYVAGMTDGDVRTLRIGAEADFDQVFEIRRLLDGLAAAHAAACTDTEKLGKIESAHARFTAQATAEEIDVINLRRADIEFHLAIVECSTSALLGEFINFLTPAVGPYWLIWMKFSPEQQRELARDTLQEHELISNAIKVGDQSLAEASMRHHFQTNHDRHRRLFGDGVE